MSLINNKTSYYIHIQLRIINNKNFIINKVISDWIYKSLSNYGNFINSIYIYIPGSDTENINILIRSNCYKIHPYQLSKFFVLFNPNPLNLIKIYGIDKKKYNNIYATLSKNEQFYIMVGAKLLDHIANYYKYKSIKTYTDYTIIEYNTDK